jgi:cytochrome c peroxidase
VTCFDCRRSGHTDAATHLVGDIRPQEFRHRIDTPPLRGIKDSPPHRHDGRLLTLEDTVEFFKLVQGLNLSEPEKKNLVAFLRALRGSPESGESPAGRRAPRRPLWQRRRPHPFPCRRFLSYLHRQTQAVFFR